MSLQTRRTRWRRLVFNPITIKELRATFRQRRFLIVYWVSLAVYSLVVLWLAAIEVGHETQATGGPVGQRLFNYCVAAQLAIVVFVLPGFAATAVTDERENQSFDLLITTALRAFDIVWGKFLACMGYAFLFLSATLPLVCVSVLFTGVRPGEILFAYAVMGMIAAMMTAIGLATSATGRSSRRSVAVTYALALLSCMGWASLVYRLRQAMPSSYPKMNLVGYYYDLVFHQGLASTLWAAVVPLVFWGIFLALLFIVSVDRLKPTTANKSTSLRILGLVAAVTILVALAVEFLTTGVSLVECAERGLVALVMESGLLAIYLVGAAAEDPRLSRRIQWQYQWASRIRWPLRIVLPGSQSGLVYVILVAALLLLGTSGVLYLALDSKSPPSGGTATLPGITQCREAVVWTAAILGAMIWCYAALARWCSTVFSGSVYARTLVIFAFVMANLIPVCLMTLTDQTILGTRSPEHEHPSTVWNLHYTSAFLTLRSAWDMAGFWPLPDRGIFRSKLVLQAGPINEPVALISFAFHLGAAGILTALGAWRQRRVIRPRLKILYPPAGNAQPHLASPAFMQGRS